MQVIVQFLFLMHFAYGFGNLYGLDDVNNKLGILKDNLTLLASGIGRVPVAPKDTLAELLKDEGLTEIQLKQLIAIKHALEAQFPAKTNQDIIDDLQTLYSGGTVPGFVPPPPPPGNVPPPPPPPGTGPIPGSSADVKIIVDASKLTQQEKESSDKVLKDLLKDLGIPKFIKKSTEFKLDTISKNLKQSKNQFRYKGGEQFAPDKLQAVILDFVKNNLSAEDKLNLNILLDKVFNAIKAKGEDFINLFEPWVLGNFEQFKKETLDLAEGFIINALAAARYRLDSAAGAILSTSNEAQQSDKEFLSIFIQPADSLDALIRRVNLLRIRRLYLKYLTLQSDLAVMTNAKSQSGEEKGDTSTKNPTMTQPQVSESDIADALKKLKPKPSSSSTSPQPPPAQPKTSPDGSKVEKRKGLVEALQLKIGKIFFEKTYLTGAYLSNYMFDPAAFGASYKSIVFDYLYPSKITIQSLNDVIKNAKNFNEIVDYVMTCMDRSNALKEAKNKNESIVIVWRKDFALNDNGKAYFSGKDLKAILPSIFSYIKNKTANVSIWADVINSKEERGRFGKNELEKIIELSEKAKTVFNNLTMMGSAQDLIDLNITTEIKEPLVAIIINLIGLAPAELTQLETRLKAMSFDEILFKIALAYKYAPK